MLGGHLDSVVDGPGMNDDGSGTMTVLGIARALSSVTGMATEPGTSPAGSPWKVRVGFWTGEEIGLWGSRAYVGSLPSGGIEAYINLDMLGSSNGVREVYDGAATPSPRASLVIGGLLSRALNEMGLVWQTASLGGSSDHASFEQALIPTGGLFSGANELKTQKQAELFGGTANAPNDPCLHLACDRTDKIDTKLLAELARAGAWAMGALASGEIRLSGE
jgi:Zn-dependent M28 family amino/carboxypeptidase